jgi:hypothetical protein
VTKLSDADLENYWSRAVRDDWHQSFVGSDIRVLIREVQRGRKDLEEAAKIADPWAGFWPQDDATEADKAVIAVRTEIAAKIRGLVSTPSGGEK